MNILYESKSNILILVEIFFYDLIIIYKYHNVKRFKDNCNYNVIFLFDNC